MIRAGNRKGVRVPIKNCKFLIRRNYSDVVTAASEDKLSSRELREKAIAEALAREEAAAAKVKALRELSERSRGLIQTLNRVPSTLIASRLAKLQEQLDQLPEEKVKQLDEELEAFMIERLEMPSYEISEKPWYKAPEVPKSSEIEIENSSGIAKIKSTASSSYVNDFPNLKPTPDYKPYSEQELFLRQLSFSRTSAGLGSVVTDIYKPKNEVKRPKSISEVTISTLLAAGCHLGHSKAMWRPSTQPFIYGEYDGIHLIDLNETYSALKRATKVVKEVSKKAGLILYVGTMKHWEQHRSLEEAAKRSNGYYVSKRWIPGTITNFAEVSKQVRGNKVTEVDMGDVPTERILQDTASDQLIKPDLVVLLNPVENRNCINECIKSRIPTIGLCDTDMEPSLLTYPIPCNDDSLRVSSLMVGLLSKAAEEGLQERHQVFKNYKEFGHQNKGRRSVSQSKRARA